MLLRYLDLLLNDPLVFLALLPGILLTMGVALLTAITIHELSHAWSAYILGDPTARALGRLSLNPRVHMDPAGTLMIILVGFGWGKPTPVDPDRLRYGGRGIMLVSLAGPISNLLMAFLLGLVFRFGWMALPVTSIAAPNVFVQPVSDIVASIIFFTVYINVVLMVFNLLPVAPLDGFKVTVGLLPEKVAQRFLRLEAYGPVLLMGVILLDLGFGFGILSRILFPPIEFFVTLVMGI